MVCRRATASSKRITLPKKSSGWRPTIRVQGSRRKENSTSRTLNETSESNIFDRRYLWFDSSCSSVFHRKTLLRTEPSGAHSPGVLLRVRRYRRCLADRIPDHLQRPFPLSSADD